MYMKRFVVVVFFVLFAAISFGQWLHVSSDGRRLVKNDGSVFFYMADTGWELFHHLISYHPPGGKSSSQWFHQDHWLDFNMAQTGHMERNNPVYEIVSHDYNLKPVKPCLDGEPQYEDLPAGFTDRNERFVAYDARQAAYWSVLAGSLGHTYGNNNIWQMYAPGRKPKVYARIPWYYAIHQPGAMQMGYMRRLFESRPFIEMVPDQDMLANVYGQDKRMIRAARGADSSFVIVYSSFGEPIHLRMDKMTADTLTGYWYNPREGKSVAKPAFKNNRKVQSFVTPSSGSRTDWVLVLDDPDKKYTDPGNFILK